MSSHSGNKRRWTCHGTVRSYSSATHCTETKEKNRNNTIPAGHGIYLSRWGSYSLINRTEKWTEAKQTISGPAFQTRHKSPWKHILEAQDVCPGHLHVCTRLYTSVPLYWSLTSAARFSVWSIFPRHRGKTEEAEANIRQTWPLLATHSTGDQ